MKPILSSSPFSPYLAGLGSGCFQRESGSDRWKDLQLAARRGTWADLGTTRHLASLGGKSLHFNKSAHSDAMLLMVKMNVLLAASLPCLSTSIIL